MPANKRIIFKNPTTLSVSESKKNFYSKPKTSFQKSPTPYRNLKAVRTGRGQQRGSCYQRSTTSEAEGGRKKLGSSGVQSPMLFRMNTGRASSMMREGGAGAVGGGGGYESYYLTPKFEGVRLVREEEED